MSLLLNFFLSQDQALWARGPKLLLCPSDSSGNRACCGGDSPIEVEMGMATSLGLSALGQTGAESEGLPTGLLSQGGHGAISNTQRGS